MLKMYNGEKFIAGDDGGKYVCRDGLEGRNP